MNIAPAALIGVIRFEDTIGNLNVSAFDDETATVGRVTQSVCVAVSNRKSIENRIGRSGEFPNDVMNPDATEIAVEDGHILSRIPLIEQGFVAGEAAVDPLVVDVEGVGDVRSGIVNSAGNPEHFVG